MVSQLSICFPELLWHGCHGLRVVLFHSWTDHVTVHNAGYFWLCFGFGENRDNVARRYFCINTTVSLISTSQWISGISVLHFYFTFSSESHFQKSQTKVCFFLHALLTSSCFTYGSEVCATWTKVAQQANILIRIRSSSIFRTLTTIPKYFDRTFFTTMLVRGRERGIWGRISKYQKPHNHSTGQITQQHFLTFLRPGLRQRGKRWRWMVQTSLPVCCLPWPALNHRHPSSHVLPLSSCSAPQHNTQSLNRLFCQTRSKKCVVLSYLVFVWQPGESKHFIMRAGDRFVF